MSHVATLDRLGKGCFFGSSKTTNLICFYSWPYAHVWKKCKLYILLSWFLSFTIWCSRWNFPTCMCETWCTKAQCNHLDSKQRIEPSKCLVHSRSLYINVLTDNSWLASIGFCCTFGFCLQALCMRIRTCMLFVRCAVSGSWHRIPTFFLSAYTCASGINAFAWQPLFP